MNIKKIIIYGSLIVCVCLIYIFIGGNRRASSLTLNYPKNGLVPDESTAIKIAEAVGNNIFGKGLKDYKPFQATLENDSIWHIYGLPKEAWFEIQIGGCPEFEIQKKDGKILRIYISK